VTSLRRLDLESGWNSIVEGKSLPTLLQVAIADVTSSYGCQATMTHKRNSRTRPSLYPSDYIPTRTLAA
jgi:hypothetical protein